MTSKTVEYCAECSHSEYSEIQNSAYCSKAKKVLDVENEYHQGIIPDWCPLPEDNQ